MGDGEQAVWERARELVAKAEAELCRYGPRCWGAEQCDLFTAAERIDAAATARGAPEEYYDTLRELEERVYRVAEALRENLAGGAVNPELLRDSARELEDILGRIDRLDLAAIEHEASREAAEDILGEASLRISRAIDHLRGALELLG